MQQGKNVLSRVHCKRTPAEDTVDNFLGSCRDRWDACPNRNSCSNTNAIRSQTCSLSFTLRAPNTYTVSSYLLANTVLTAEKSFGGQRASRYVKISTASWTPSSKGSFLEIIVGDFNVGRSHACGKWPIWYWKRFVFHRKWLFSHSS